MTSAEFINLKNVPFVLKLKVREWRNSPQVSKFFQLSSIDLETHKNWLKSLDAPNPSTIAFLIQINKKYIGMAYFSSINYSEKTTNWGMYIYELNMRGIGIGKEVIRWSIKYAKNELSMALIRLEVLNNNKIAKSLYQNHGFSFIKEKKPNVLLYELRL